MFTKGSTAIDASVGKAAAVGAGDVAVEVSLARWKYQRTPPPSSSTSVSIPNSGVVMRCWARSPWYQARMSATGKPIRSATVVSCWICLGQSNVALKYSRTCSSTHAAAAYAMPHCTTLRRRSLAHVLSPSRSAGASFTRRPPVSRAVYANRGRAARRTRGRRGGDLGNWKPAPRRAPAAS